MLLLAPLLVSLNASAAIGRLGRKIKANDLFVLAMPANALGKVLEIHTLMAP